MTSKEALEYVKNHNKCYAPVNMEVFKVIEKDLEILEAIKDLLDDGNLWIAIEHEMVESELSKKKKQLIKEWINNGKINI